MKRELENYWRENKIKFEEIVEKLDYLPNGVLYTEGLLLCSVFDLLEVDLILESGTAYGQSTELMANYFDKRIITVDFDKIFEQHENTSKRLSKYSNVSCKIGDSFNVLPFLANKYKDKKIGVFIDGPKNDFAMYLGAKLFKYPNVSCIMYHDQGINEQMSGKHFDTKSKGELGFINRDYGYLNDKVLKAFPEMERYLPDGPGVFIQLK